MTDALAREWCFYFYDMLVFAEKVLGYTDDFDRQLPLYFCNLRLSCPLFLILQRDV